MNFHEYQAKKLFAAYGIPVPAGFTLTTEVCTYYYDHDHSYPATIEAEVDEQGNIKPKEPLPLTPGSTGRSWPSRLEMPRAPCR